jgi:quercetin dioxygenase-like cupin family protein
MGAYDSVSRVRPRQIWTGAVARPVQGEQITMAVVDLEPNLEVPEHHHVNEQVGLVLDGVVTMVIGGEPKRLQAGETYVIPSDVPHSASTGPEGAAVIDVFTPIRAEWAQAPELEPGPGRWPA